MGVRMPGHPRLPLLAPGKSLCIFVNRSILPPASPILRLSGVRDTFADVVWTNHGPKSHPRRVRRQKIVRWHQDRFRVNERRGRPAMRFEPSVHRYQSNRDDQAAPRQRMGAGQGPTGHPNSVIEIVIPWSAVQIRPPLPVLGDFPADAEARIQRRGPSQSPASTGKVTSRSRRRARAARVKRASRRRVDSGVVVFPAGAPIALCPDLRSHERHCPHSRGPSSAQSTG